MPFREHTTGFTVYPGAAPDEPAAPGFTETLGAGFALENDVVAAWDLLTRKGHRPDPSFQPSKWLKENDLWEMRDNFLGVRSADEAQARFGRIKEEQRQRDVLERAGWGGVAAAVGGALVSPTLFIPLLTPWRGARGVAAAAGLGLTAGVAQEVPLAAAQETRTPGEVGFSIAASTVLGGLLGGAVLALRKGEFQAIEQSMANPPRVIAIPTHSPAPAGAQVTRSGISDLKAGAAPVANVLDSNPVTRSPVTDAFTSDYEKSRWMMAQLGNGGLTHRQNADFIPTGEGGTVENAVTTWYGGYYKYVLATDDAYSRYVFDDAPPTAFRNIRAAVRGRLTEDKMSRPEFREQVSIAIANGTHENKYVMEAAEAAKREIYDPLLKAGKEAKVFGENLPEHADPGYVNWVPNHEAIMANPNGFVAFLASKYNTKLQQEYAQKLEKFEAGRVRDEELIEDLLLSPEEIARRRDILGDELRALEAEKNAAHFIALEDTVAILRDAAKRLKGGSIQDEAMRKQMLRDAKDMLDAAGGEYKKLKGFRAKLKRRLSNMNKAKVVYEDRVAKKLEKIERTEELSLATLERAVRVGRKFLGKMDRLSDEEFDRAVDELKGQFAKAGEVYDRGQERLVRLADPEIKGQVVPEGERFIEDFRNIQTGTQAIDWFTQNSIHQSHRLIARQIAPYVRDVPIRTVDADQVVNEPEVIREALQQGLGIHYIFPPQAGRNANKEGIVLRGAGFSQSGLTERTLLHELVHSAVGRQYTSSKSRGGGLYQRTRALTDLITSHMVKEFIDPATDAVKEGKRAIFFEQMYDALIADPEELFTYGLSSRQFQSYLRSITITEDEIVDTALQYIAVEDLIRQGAYDETVAQANAKEMRKEYDEYVKVWKDQTPHKIKRALAEDNFASPIERLAAERLEIDRTKKQSFWNFFVDMVRRSLGLDATQDNALNRVIEASDFGFAISKNGAIRRLTEDYIQGTTPRAALEAVDEPAVHGQTVDDALLREDALQEARADKLTGLAARIEEAEGIDRAAMRDAVQEGLDAILTRANRINGKRAVRAAKLAEQAKALDPKLVDERIGKIRESVGARRVELEESVRLAGGKFTDAGIANVDFTEEAERLAYATKDKFLGTTMRLPVVDIMQGERGSALPRLLGFIRTQEMAPWLEKDIEKNVRIYLRTMAPDIEIAKRFGDVHGGKHWDELVDELNFKLKNVEAAVDDKGKPRSEKWKQAETLRIQAEYARQKQNLEVAFGRLRHTRGLPKDPDSAGARLYRVVSQLNVLRFMGMVTVSSIPDLAKPVMRNGLLRTYRDGFSPLVSNLRGMKMMAHEARMMGVAIEALINTRAHAVLDIMDEMGRYSKLERGVEYLTGKMGSIALFSHWTDAMKIFSANISNIRMLEAVAAVNTGKGMPQRQAQEFLAANGIDAGLAQRIWKEVEQHAGGGKIDGVWLPQTENWTDEGARQAFRQAVAREVNNTIVTPGIERPAWTDASPAFKLLAQFKSFGFSSTTRTVMSGLQQHDMAVANGFVLSLALGALSYYLYSIVKGNELSDDPAVWADEALQRSGMLAVFGMGQDMLSRIPGAAPYATFSGQRTTRRGGGNDLADEVFGPSFDFAKQSMNIVTGIDDPTQSTVHAGRLLMPFQNTHYLSKIWDAIEASIPVPERRQ